MAVAVWADSTDATARLELYVKETPPARGNVDTVIFLFDTPADAEQYRIRLTDPTDIEVARELFTGSEAPRIPTGVVIRGNSDINVGYSWHIDPDTVEFADVTTEVCDGLPSDVEKGLITSNRYCPWSAEVIAIE